VRLVVDSDVLAAPRSGVGVYLTELLSRLEHTLQIERRTTASTQAPGAERRSVEKRSFVRQLPLAYDLRQALLGMPPTKALFFAPNFILPPKALARGPRVVTVHDLIFFDHPEWADATRGGFLRRALPATVKGADAIIAVSEQTKRELDERFGVGQKTHVIANGIRRWSLQRSRTPRGVLCLGNIEPRKDPLTLLYAHRALPAELRVQHPLTFVGGALDVAYAKRLTTALDPPNARWVGSLSDDALQLLVAEAALVVTPSRAEGFGIVPLEMAAAGVPVVSADITITKELLGSYGDYYEVGNVESLRSVLHNALRAPKTPDATALYQRYAWDQSAAQHLELFKSLGG
jgi:glycosyltransferase involved in cell wall biosynthesis